jgi:hypothetical protein
MAFYVVDEYQRELAVGTHSASLGNGDRQKSE